MPNPPPEVLATPSEIPVPSLELRQLSRSKDSVIDPSDTLQMFMECGPNFVVATQGQEQIGVFDEKGEEISGKDPKKWQKGFRVDVYSIMEAIAAKNGVALMDPKTGVIQHIYIATDISLAYERDIFVKNPVEDKYFIPTEQLRDISQRVFLDRNVYAWVKESGKVNFQNLLVPGSNKQSSSYIAYREVTRDTEGRQAIFKDPQIQVIEDRYIFLYDLGEREFTYFDTQDAQGRPLSPRGWIRHCSVQLEEGTIPASIRDYFKVIIQNKQQETARLTNKQPGESLNPLIPNVNLLIRTNEIIFLSQEGRELKKETIPNVGNNVTVIPGPPPVVYFCSEQNPRHAYHMELADDPTTWFSQEVEFPKRYPAVHNLRLDPQGGFLFFDRTGDNAKKEIVILDPVDLEEVGVLEADRIIKFHPDGRIFTLDEQGHLVIFETNLAQIDRAKEQRRTAQLLAAIDVETLLGEEAGASGYVQETSRSKGGVNLEAFDSIKTQWEKKFQERIDQATESEELEGIRAGMEQLQQTLRAQRTDERAIIYITEGIGRALQSKQKELAEPIVRESIVSIREKLNTLSISTIGEVRDELEGVKGMKVFIEASLRKEVDQLAQEFHEKTEKFFQTQGAEFIKQVDGLTARVEEDLKAMEAQTAFEDWQEYTYPQLMTHLGMLDRDCPLDANEAHQKITQARSILQKLSGEYEEKFRDQYEGIRAKASEQTSGLKEAITHDVEQFFRRLSAKKFTSRAVAKSHIEASEARKSILTQIEILREREPESAGELERALKVQVAMTLGEIGRVGEQGVDDSGRQMVSLGGRTFLRWEGEVKKEEKKETEKKPRVDLTFTVEEKSKGPGIKSDQLMGDVALRIQRPGEEIQTVRLYEGWANEDNWRYGGEHSKGSELPAAYMTQGEYRKLAQLYRQWGTEEKPGPLRKQYETERAKVEAHFNSRPEKGSEGETQWKDQLLGENGILAQFGQFCAQNQIALLRRIEQVQKAPVLETGKGHLNGKGFVPGWSPHWTLDAQTDVYLGEMAQHLQMQGDLKEGLLNLAGHAGTGKDVLIKMFCNRTNRPYFAVDCSKWMTEYELSEDIILDSPSGFPMAVKVPSMVLIAIQKPGAVLYFNEFNAMPEQAQIFLHALFDEKRAVTLKTSSGKTIKADPSVLFVSSMNPGYPGTFDPQYATRSRMHTMQIDYPPLKKTTKEGDLYDASEALRIARSTRSLRDLTDDPDMETNEFVQVWNHDVNRLQNGAMELSPEQDFDLNVILGLVQFSAKLREAFSARFENRSDSAARKLMKELPVTQPLTLREMRRCAWNLGTQIPMSKKTDGSLTPEQVAKDLIHTYFLCHIQNAGDRQQIETQMKTWTTEKRMAAAA